MKTVQREQIEKMILRDLHPFQQKQHEVEKETKELEVAYESLYLDDEQETVSGIKRKEQDRVEVTRNRRIRT